MIDPAKLLEGLTSSFMLDLAADYIQRGRPYAGMPTPTLQGLAAECIAQMHANAQPAEAVDRLCLCYAELQSRGVSLEWGEDTEAKARGMVLTAAEDGALDSAIGAFVGKLARPDA